MSRGSVGQVTLVEKTPYEAIVARLSEATPVEVDTEIARIQGLVNSAESWIQFQAQRVAQYKKGQSRYTKGVKSENGFDGWAYHQKQIDECETEIRERKKTVAGLLAQRKPLDEEYERRPWQRWFGVDKGHIHPTSRCQTFNRFLQTKYQGSYVSDTIVLFLPALSGRLVSDIVEEYGTDVCSHCCSAAPVAGESKSGKEKAARKAERDAERARRAAERAEKAIANPDGTPLHLRHTVGTIATLITARSELVDTLCTLTVDRVRPMPNRAYFQEYVADVETLVSAIMHKTGQSRADLLFGELFEKVVKKVRGYNPSFDLPKARELVRQCLDELLVAPAAAPALASVLVV